MDSQEKRVVIFKPRKRKNVPIVYPDRIGFAMEFFEELKTVGITFQPECVVLKAHEDLDVDVRVITIRGPHNNHSYNPIVIDETICQYNWFDMLPSKNRYTIDIMGQNRCVNDIFNLKGRHPRISIYL
jgi:hypothetical protein